MSYYRKDIVRPVIISVDTSGTPKICSNLINLTTNNTIYKLKYPFSSMNFSKSMKIKKFLVLGFLMEICTEAISLIHKLILIFILV